MKINTSLLIELTKRDFLDRYAGSILGIWWSFIWPLVNIFIYMIIFSKVMSAKLAHIPSEYSYGLYLAAGILPWTAFANTISRSSNIFVEKKFIITKIPIQLPILPLSIVLSESITFFVSLFFFTVILLLLGIVPSKFVILLPIIFGMQQLLAFSFGLLLATLNVFIRDIKEIVNIVIQIWFWFTPIVYVKDILPKTVKDLLVINPAYSFIHFYQNVFVTSKPINFKLILLYFIFTTFLFLFSYYTFKKLSKDVRDFL